jgi:hypothetical protein
MRHLRRIFLPRKTNRSRRRETRDGRATIFLTRFASQVIVAPPRNAPGVRIMQDKALANPKISFEWNAEVERSRRGEGRSHGHGARNIKTGERKEVPVEGVFVAIGHPEHRAGSRSSASIRNGVSDPYGCAHESMRRLRLRRRAGITSIDGPSPQQAQAAAAIDTEHFDGAPSTSRPQSQ